MKRKLNEPIKNNLSTMMKRIINIFIILFLFLIVIFYIANAADESIIINYNSDLSYFIGMVHLGVRPYQNIGFWMGKGGAEIQSHSYNRDNIIESVHRKIEENDPFIYYIYRFPDPNGYENLTQIVNEKTKIVEKIQLTINLSYEIKVFGSLEEACLAVIESFINSRYLEKDIDYKFIDEFIHSGKKIWIKGIKNSIIYELINIQKDKKDNYYLVATFLKNTNGGSAKDKTSSSYQVIQYPIFDSYQWEVGIPGFFEPGEITKFKDTTISTVQLSSPSNGETLPLGDITFSWNPVSNATKYQFIFYNRQGQVALDTTKNTTSLTIPLAGGEGTITWKVRAGDNSGNWSAWSSSWSLNLKSNTTISPDFSLQGFDTAHSLTGSLHCPDKTGYACPSCSTAPGYDNHFKGFNVLTTNEDCYVKLTYNDGDYIGNQNNYEVTIKGEKWLGLENESGTELVEEINKGNFDFARANKFIKRTMNFPGDNYKYEFADEGKEFRLYLSRSREEAFKAVPWKNITVEIKNKETDKIFKYKFSKGIFPRAYSWSNGGVANYGQCVWWTAKRWVEEVDSKTLFPFYPPSPEAVNVKTIDSNYQPKKYDVLINYKPGGPPEHYGFVEKVEGDKMYISQFNWIKPGEVYNYIIRTWNGNTTSLFYSGTFDDKYYFKYYYRRMSTVSETDTYALRDIGPAEGQIFYDKGSYSNGWRYLEATPKSTEWTGKKWGSKGTLIGGTETGIGTGQNNTTKIVTWLNSYSETDCAAQLCDALVYGGYSDWFLPSKDELNLMYENLYLEGVGDFSVGYWSSSEDIAYTACSQGFYNGGQFFNAKDDNLRVRAVRAF